MHTGRTRLLVAVSTAWACERGGAARDFFNARHRVWTITRIA